MITRPVRRAHGKDIRDTRRARAVIRVGIVTTSTDPGTMWTRIKENGRSGHPDESGKKD